MRVISTTVYTFEELSPSAQATALDECRYFGVEHDWWDGVYEDAARVGVKITSFDLDRNRHAEGNFTCPAHEVAQNIFNEHGEQCETHKTAAAFMGGWQPVFDNYMDETHPEYESREAENKLMELEEEFLKSILEDYSIILQHECEYLSSDEAVEEMIRANGYEYTADGRLV
jgi:hypothetical protein